MDIDRSFVCSNLKRRFAQIALFLIIVFVHVPINNAEYSMTILHTGDIHARFQQFDQFAGTCSAEESDNGECYGGFARLAQAVMDIREAESNVLLLDAGDVFSGSLWFLHYQGRASAHFMNRLGYDAQAIGNHEFDEGPAVFAEYLKNLTAPMICTNIDVSREHVLEGLVMPSVVLTVNGKRIGIVGYILPVTTRISNPGNVAFTDEIDALQAEVDSLTEDGVNKIIALGHSGFQTDQQIAARVRGVDIVVGGHSSTFLYTETPPDLEVPVGDYPYLVTADDGSVVPIVHANDFGKYLGRLDVTFDDDGNLIEYDRNPILLNNDVERDAATLSEINKWAKQVHNITSKRLGKTHVLLDGTRESCRIKECNLGNLITDAFLWKTLSGPVESGWSDIAIAIINGGGIRSSIPQGEITFGDVQQVLTFGNTLDTLDLQGKYVREMLEESIGFYDPETPVTLLQMSGMWVTYDISQDIGSRVVDVLVRCTECDYPELIPLNGDKMYKMAVQTFVASRDVIAEYAQNRYSGVLDSSVLAEYIEKFSSVYPGVERRITFIDGDDNQCDDQQRNRKMRKQRP